VVMEDGMNTTFLQLRDDEKREIGERIARGEVVPDNDAQADAFDLMLDSGINVRGLYRWGSEFGEFEQFEVVA